MIDGVELLGPVHRDDGDIAVGLVLHGIVGHASSPACSIGNNSASTTRTRSSHNIAARAVANFGFKAGLES